MPKNDLNASFEGIKSLLRDVQKAGLKGSYELMKNNFLGGMRDGESWGLRKWLSKNGGALKICNDIELIWGALRDLPRQESTTKELANILRPKAKFALNQLRSGVPKAYQEVSTAHPYLPFFHRLECALKGLSEFDPDDDGIICIDDSSDEDDDTEKIKKPAQPAMKNKHSVEIVFDDENDNAAEIDGYASFKGSSLETNDKIYQANVVELAHFVEDVAMEIESGSEIRPPNIDLEEYWTLPENYLVILRLFREILLQNKSGQLIDNPPAETERYIAMIKNPLCFRDIVITLKQYKTDSNETRGHLPCPSLKRWNMFEGKYLIQAVDMVFLNNLAFFGKSSSVTRKLIQNQRSHFWREIRKAASKEFKCVPVRRTETSEFVIRK